jgi:6-phosphogluconolactonase
MKSILTIGFTFLFLTALAQKKDAYLLIGTYTSGKSQGIYVYKFNTETADNNFVTAIGASNPSFLAVSPDKKFVYAVNENTAGTVIAYSFDQRTGNLSPINTQPSGGSDPCFVSIDATGKWLFAGNYSSGTIGLFPIKADGSLDAVRQVIQHSGSGPDTARQRSAHVHSTNLSPDQHYLFAADLGTDKIMAYAFDSNQGTLFPATNPSVSCVPGSGPRHMAFSRDNKFAYLVEEMTGTIVTYSMSKDKLVSRQRTSALPKDFKGFISAADIHISPDGKFLYCSNRGESNSISIFSINKMTGKLTMIGNQSSLGKKPRNFNFDPSGNFLLVANQDTDEVIIFKINRQTGLLTDTGKRLAVPSPVCIKWIQ